MIKLQKRAIRTTVRYLQNLRINRDLLFCFVAIVLSFFTVLTSRAQSKFENVETISANIGAYFSNCGMLAQNGRLVGSGLWYPRVGGYSYATGGGIWLGALKELFGEYRPFVFKTFDPNSGHSMAVPGEYTNGNLYRQDLIARYGVQRTLNGEVEQFNTVFHDGDPRYFKASGDTSGFGASGRPLGFQLSQMMKGYTSSEFGNCLVIESRTRYIGSQAIDSVAIAFVIDVAVGPNDDTFDAHFGNSCRILATSSGEIVVTERLSKSGIDYGAIGIGVIDASPSLKLTGSKAPTSSETSALWENSHQYKYLVNSNVAIDSDTADRVVFVTALSERMETLDSFKFTIGIVVMSREVMDRDEKFIQQFERLKEVTTTVESNESYRMNNSLFCVSISSNSLSLSDADYNGKVQITSILGDSSVRVAVNGSINVSDLPSGIYHIRQVDIGAQQTMLLHRWQ